MQGFCVADELAFSGRLPGRHEAPFLVVTLGLAVVGEVVHAVVRTARLVAVQSVDAHQLTKVDVVDEAQCRLERLVHVGSIASLFLGDPQTVITDTAPPDAKNEFRGDYARAKVAVDRLLLDMHRDRGLPVCILRPGVVLGQGGTPFHSGVGFYNNDQHCLGWNAGRNPLPLVLVEDVAELGKPEMVHIKGAANPVPARKLLNVNDHKGSRIEPTLVGRTWELNTIAGILDEAIDVAGCVVGVVGPPGIGKSRLVRESARLARTRDRSPSSSLPKRSYSNDATAQFSTLSPRNSSRSLCVAA